MNDFIPAKPVEEIIDAAAAGGDLAQFSREEILSARGQLANRVVARAWRKEEIEQIKRLMYALDAAAGI